MRLIATPTKTRPTPCLPKELRELVEEIPYMTDEEVKALRDYLKMKIEGKN